MQHIKFNKTICGVNLLLNAIDFQTECPFKLSTETVSADYFQIFFLKQANGLLKLNDEVISLKSNSIVFISKDQHHSWHVDSSKFEGHLLLFQDEFLNDFFSDQHFIFRLLYFYQTEFPLIIEVGVGYMDENLLKLKEIKHELVHSKTDSVHIIRSLLYYILITLNRNYSQVNHLKNAISIDNTAYQFRKLVEEHIYKLHRVEDYSDLMKLSRVSLNKAVKNQFNMTATEFIKSRLLFEIKMKLIHTSKTIAEIAYQFNFSEANHMSRLFKQKSGFTPLEYRIRYQNGL